MHVSEEGPAITMIVHIAAPARDSVANRPIVRPHVKKGRIKSGAAGQICGRILADFEQKRAEKGPNFKKNDSLLLSSLIPGKYKKFSFLHRPEMCFS